MLGVTCRVAEGAIGASSILRTPALVWLSTAGGVSAPETQQRTRSVLSSKGDGTVTATFFAGSSTLFPTCPSGPDPLQARLHGQALLPRSFWLSDSRCKPQSQSDETFSSVDPSGEIILRLRIRDDAPSLKATPRQRIS